MSAINEMLVKNWWTLERFGFSPAKIPYRVSGGIQDPKIACICVPKSGTHLLERALCLHPRLYRKFIRTVHEGNYDQLGGVAQIFRSLTPRQILITHLFYSEERNREIQTNGLKSVFMFRDPRDVVVSDAFYIKKRKDHQLNKLFEQQTRFEDCLKIVIQGNSEPYYSSIAERLENFAGWLTSGAFNIRFEDMVGARGGGSDEAQMNVLRTLFEYLELEMSESDLIALRDGLFSNASPTFRKGRIGGWKEHFNPEIKALFKDVTGDYLLRYGYEENTAW